MKTKKSFKLILEGPAGSGKSTFLSELLHQWQVKPSWQKHYTFTIPENCPKHELLVETFLEHRKELKIMAGFTTLLGAEDVMAAGSAIHNAAKEMIRAASLTEDSLSRHRIFLDDWLLRLESMVKEVKDNG